MVIQRKITKNLYEANFFCSKGKKAHFSQKTHFVTKNKKTQ